MALSADGRMLAYINSAAELAVYDRATRASVTGLLEPAAIESMAIGGDRSLFVSTVRTGLLHMDLYTGEVTTILPELPELTAPVAKASLLIACPFYCYGPIEPVYLASPGARLQVGTSAGTTLSSDWIWSIGGDSSPQETFQIPYGLSERQTVTLTRADLPSQPGSSRTRLHAWERLLWMNSGQ